MYAKLFLWPAFGTYTQGQKKDNIIREHMGIGHVETLNLT
jgi:hypothetical protein